MRGWWQEITGLVLPADCAGCGHPRTALCDACAWALHGRPAAPVRPAPAPDGLPEVWAAAPYQDAVRAMLLAHKERGALGLARPLGTALAGAVRGLVGAAGPAPGLGGVGVGGAVRVGGGGAGEWGDGGGEGGGGEGAPSPCPVPVSGRQALAPGVPVAPVVMLVPVPSARRAVRARGHDAVRRVAGAAAGVLRGVGVAALVVPVLRQGRVVADQAGLDATRRLVNLAGALEVVPGRERLLRGGRVVLVDDLMTTGASLAEAARAVRVALGKRVGADAGTGGEGGLVGAAVVGASPKAFAINRN